MSIRGLVKILVLTLALANVAMAAGRSPEQIDAIEKDIGNKVICLCGCQASLNDCPMLHCEVKAKMHAIIRTDLAEGKSEHAVLQDLVAHYGERVLAAPPPHGFNLTAWILPAVGLLIGLFLAITFVRKWRRPALQAAAPAAAAAPPVNEKARTAVEKEMKDFVD